MAGHAGKMNQAQAVVIIAAELRLFLRPGRRSAPVAVVVDGTSSLGHVVESLGVPLTEAGRLLVNGSRPRPGTGRAAGCGDRRGRAATAAAGGGTFCSRCSPGHAGAPLRLAGVDAAYGNDAGDDALIEQANADRRVLLTQDRGLLRRRALWLGAYVRGTRPDDQFRDVLDRFKPPLAPWTRCPACNGPLSPVAKAVVPPCCLPAPGAPTRRSPAAAAAARCTGTAPTASDLSRSSTWQSAPSALAQADKSYQRQMRAFGRAVPRLTSRVR